MKIVPQSLKNVCYACPSAWEGVTEDNRPVYIKFRRDEFKVYIGEPNTTVSDMFFAEKWPGPKLRIIALTQNVWAGFMNNQDMHQLLIAFDLSSDPSFEIPKDPDPNANYDQDALLNFLENRND